MLRDTSNRRNLYKRLDSDADKPWTPRTVRELCAEASKDAHLALVVPEGRAWAVAPEAWANALQLLRAIPTLVMDTTGDVCCYHAGQMKGLVARCDTKLFEHFVQNVGQTPPKTLSEFLRLVPA